MRPAPMFCCLLLPALVSAQPGPAIRVLDYQGKYAGDLRFLAVRAGLPGMVAAARALLEERLGLQAPGDLNTVIRFADSGEVPRRGLRASTGTEAVDGKTVTVMEFYTEYVVLSPRDFQSRLAHELKHALFRHLMGPAYTQLPGWVREGLAIHAANQLEDRMAQLLGHAVHGGRDPLALLQGFSAPRSGFEDYLEDGLVFAWLEDGRPGAVKRFCAGLLEGAEPLGLLAALGDCEPDRVVGVVRAYAKRLVRAALEPGLGAFLAIREAEERAGTEVPAWLAREGERAWEGWLRTHPGHVLRPVVRFRLGRCLVKAGRGSAGRAWLARVIGEDFPATSLADEAAYWLVRSFLQTAGQEAAARHAAGIFLRDFSWARRAGSLQGRFPPAGPVLPARPGSGILGRTALPEGA